MSEKITSNVGCDRLVTECVVKRSLYSVAEAKYNLNFQNDLGKIDYAETAPNARSVIICASVNPVAPAIFIRS